MIDIIINILVFISALSATYLLANKNKLGFLCFVIVEVCYVYIGMKTKQYGIVGISVMYFFMNIYGWIKWSREHD